MEEAASLPLVALTAWQALVERADLKPGQKVLIHAGSGGLGSIAIQLAKHLGAAVATTTSTANVESVKALGADIVIDYRTSDFETVLHDYDIVFDTLGGDTLNKSFGVLKRGGKLISVAGPPDPAFAKSAGLNPILRQAIRLLSYPTRRTAQRRGVSYSFLWMKANGDQLAEIALLVDSGIIRPVIDRVFPFESDQGGIGLRRPGTRERQGRRHDELSIAPAAWRGRGKSDPDLRHRRGPAEREPAAQGPERVTPTR
jgi:alcohol dehydrogenase